MRLLMFPLGTLGDVIPYVRVGARMKSRGHDVTLITVSRFGEIARNSGLDFESIADAGEFQAILDDPAVWEPVRGIEILLNKVAVALMPAIYDRIAAEKDKPGLLVVAPPLAFGARAAREKWGIRMATFALQPSLIRSIDGMPRLAGVPDVRRWPKSLRKATMWAVDRSVDLMCAGAVNRFRRSRSIPGKARDILLWWLSDMAVVCLFPTWYAPPRPDWSPEIIQTSFPLARLSEMNPNESDGANPALEVFIEAGEPPVLFTFGSGMFHSRGLFQTAVEVCRIAKRRALLISAATDQLPRHVPETVMRIEYADFARIFPRCGAVVHHGGIGTTAEAIRAGVPQLVMPMSYDQPDNADRVKQMGMGDWLRPWCFNARRVAEKLSCLTEEKAVKDACRRYAEKARQGDGVEKTCDVLEGL